MESAEFFTVAETATRASNYRWFEQRLFELLGSWVSDPSLDDLETKYVVGTQSYHHEFLAELWAKRLPMLGYDPAPVAPSSEIDDGLSVDRWRTYPTSGKLAGLYRVILPRMASTYTSHLASTNEMADGPTVRALNLCLNDYRTDWIDGEFLLQSVISDATDLSEAYSVQRQVEEVFSATTGVL